MFLFSSLCWKVIKGENLLSSVIMIWQLTKKKKESSFKTWGFCKKHHIGSGTSTYLIPEFKSVTFAPQCFKSWPHFWKLFSQQVQLDIARIISSQMMPGAKVMQRCDSTTHQSEQTHSNDTFYPRFLTTVKSLLIISGSTGDTRQRQQNRAASSY